MPRKPLDYGSATEAEFLEMVEAGLSGMEISKATGLSENQAQHRAKNLGACINGAQTMRERKLIKRGAYFVREEHSAFTSWSLASRNGGFVLDPTYMSAMRKFGFLRQDGGAWRATIDPFGKVTCGARP